MFTRAVRIIESTLLLKQHGWRDIAGGLVAISARDPSFTHKRAERLADGLFQEVPEGMAPEDVLVIRNEIKALYQKLMEEISSRPEDDFNQVLIDYVKGIEPETGGA